MLGLSVRAQTPGNKNCNQLLKGYITDEQEYLIKTEDISRFDIIFYQGFTYRIALCTLDEKVEFEFTLMDEKGNVQYRNNVKRNFTRDFNFETVFHGQIIIKPLIESNRASEILIGYKKIK